MKKALILGCLAGTLAIILLIRFYPPTDDFNLDNPFWNGLKNFKQGTKASSVNLTSAVSFTPSPSESALFIIAPSGEFSTEEMSLLSSYLKEGGTLVLADDFGSGNSILEGLGLLSRFSRRLVVDPLFRGKASVLPKTVNLSGSLAQINSLMFNYPTSLQIETGEAGILATSSSFSYFEDSLNGQTDKKTGPFSMIAEFSYGKGRIYLVSDSSLFINSMLKEEENGKFLKTITEGKSIFVDTSYYPMGILPRLKNGEVKIYQLASRFEIKYSLFLILVLFVSGMRFKRKETESGEDEQDIMQRHPRWDKKILIKLKKELKNE